jgi:RNA polymerase sigma-70 factor (sigma-E family)
MSRRNAGLEFERFVTDSVDDLLRTAHLIVWDETEAEDLVQESFIKLAKRWPRVRNMESPRAYARRVLVNMALDGRKSRARWRQELNGELPHDAADDGSARDLKRVDARDELLCALSHLPPRQRSVLVLRYLADLSEAQVAEALGCSVGTVKSTTSRALEALGQTLQPAHT